MSGLSLVLEVIGRWPCSWDDDDDDDDDDAQICKARPK